MATLTGTAGVLYAVALSADGHLLASGGPDGTVRPVGDWHRATAQEPGWAHRRRPWYGAVGRRSAVGKRWRGRHRAAVGGWHWASADHPARLSSAASCRRVRNVRPDERRSGSLTAASANEPLLRASPAGDQLPNEQSSASRHGGDPQRFEDGHVRISPADQTAPKSQQQQQHGGHLDRRDTGLGEWQEGERQ